MQKITLCAEDLWSKWGFGDGNPFRREDHGPEFDDVDDALLDQINDLPLDGRCDLLDELIRAHLIPAVIAATGTKPNLTFVYTHHNPTRDAGYEDGSKAPNGWDAISVEIGEDDVRAAMEALASQPRASALIDAQDVTGPEQP